MWCEELHPGSAHCAASQVPAVSQWPSGVILLVPGVWATTASAKSRADGTPSDVLCVKPHDDDPWQRPPADMSIAESDEHTRRLLRDVVFEMLSCQASAADSEMAARVVLALHATSPNTSVQALWGMLYSMGSSRKALRLSLLDLVRPWPKVASGRRAAETLLHLIDLLHRERASTDGGEVVAPPPEELRMPQPPELTDELAPGQTVSNWLRPLRRWLGLGASFETRALFSTPVTFAKLQDKELLQQLRSDLAFLKQRFLNESNLPFNNDQWHAWQREQELGDLPGVAGLRSVAERAFATHNLAAGGQSPANVDVVVWAASLVPGDPGHQKHTHFDTLCTGVLYLDTPPGSAPIIFSDPRGTPRMWMEGREAAARTDSNWRLRPAMVNAQWLGTPAVVPFSGRAAFFPSEGDLLLFPPWLTHEVPEADVDIDAAIGERTSFAFDLLPRYDFGAWGSSAGLNACRGTACEG